MTTPDIELILDRWLGEGTDVLPDRSVEAVLRTVERTSQRRAFGSPWRFPTMNGSSKLALSAGAAAVVVLVAGGLIFYGGSRAPSVGGPTPSSAPTVSPIASAVPSRAPSSALGLKIGPGVDADGTIVFGLHDQVTDTDRLFAIAPDGTDEGLISDGGACCLSLQPDGLAALVATDVDGRMVPAIFRLPRGVQVRSARTWDDFSPGLDVFPGAWSIEGNLAFEGSAESDPSKTGIYLSEGTGTPRLRGDLVRLTSNPGPQADIPIAFSPDGSKLLFVRETPNAERTGDLYVIGTGGYLTDKGSGTKHYQPGDLRKLNPANVGVAVSDLFGPGASWSPDGTRVAFSGFDATPRPSEPYSATSRAYIVDVADGEATPITADSTNMTSARWSPNGEWIAYDFDHPDGTGGRDVWLVRPDGTDAHQVTVTNGSCCATWSPDSSWLLFQGNDADGAGLFIAKADGSGYSRLLTVDSEYDLRWKGWGPEPDRTP